MSNRNRGSRDADGDAFVGPSDEQLQRIITDPEGADLLVQWADRIGKALAKPLSTSQIRSIFSEVRRIEADWKQDRARASRNLALLKPKMAYRARKEQGKGVEHLVSVLTPAVKLVGNDEQRFRNFVDFFEAILAYHRAYGGK